MAAQVCFFISIAFSFIAWGIVAKRYLWPKLHLKSRDEALRPLLILHAFRFEGLAFLVPGIVSPNLPAAFAHAAAYGDFTAAILALLSLASLEQSGRNPRLELQSLGHVRSIERILSSQCGRTHGGPIGRHLLHTDAFCAAAADHARAGIPHFAAASEVGTESSRANQYQLAVRTSKPVRFGETAAASRVY